jgi:hypothetical protein
VVLGEDRLHPATLVSSGIHWGCSPAPQNHGRNILPKTFFVKPIDFQSFRAYIWSEGGFVTPEEELKHLKELLVQATNLFPPPNPDNLPSGPPELVHGYRTGYSNGWVAYRQHLKKLIFPQGT